MKDPATAYRDLLSRLRQVATLDSIGSLLSWDEQTQMPPKGADLRAEQAGLIARLSHEQFTSLAVGELLDAAGSSPLAADPESDAAVNVRETRRRYDRARKLPSSLVEEMTRTAVLAQQAWVEARKRSDYPYFQPWLEKTLSLKRQEAACVGHTGHIYNALLDPYEPNETAEQLREVFRELREPLVALVGKIVGSGRTAPVELLHRRFPVDAQRQLARLAAERIGFDFAAGRLDVAVHPFCSGIGPGDCRMTTRYDERDFGNAFFSTLHETGHALYDQGLPTEHWGSPRGEFVSLGIHESQSRMWENLVGRSSGFWRYFMPHLRAAFPGVLEDVAEDQWVWAINDVRTSFIRTESDEVTYNLHVLLRFELEQDLLDGSLASGDVPDAWQAKMRNYLGMVPPDDAQGCLQDVHWSIGAVGYFPTYTLGNLYAAQFFEKARADLGELDRQMERGEFAPLLGWLRENIHRHGRRYPARQLVKRVTGRELSAAPLLGHLATKARELYGVSA